MTQNQAISKVLFDKRISLGITRSHVARTLGVERATVRNKEIGTSCFGLLEIDKLCEIYHYDKEEMMNEALKIVS